MLPLSVSELILDGTELVVEPRGDLAEAVRAHLAGWGQSGLVVLGSYGSGKSTLCHLLASDQGSRCAEVPLRVVGRHPTLVDGLRAVIGESGLAEVARGELLLLLDGLDELPEPDNGSWQDLFDELVSLAGSRWVLTSRPGWFRTDDVCDDQVDSLSRADTRTLLIRPLDIEQAHDTLRAIAGADQLMTSVRGLVHLATSPLLLNVLTNALPYIEPGRPIHPWGLFDAWIRHALSTGPGHDAAITRLEEAAWTAFESHHWSLEPPRLQPEAVAQIHPALRRALLVNELDGGVRFGHRSVYEFLIASRLAPAIAANQGNGPDTLSGVRITYAMRSLCVGNVDAMPLEWDHARRRVRIPRGNFIAGGDLSPDERPLRIAHLSQPFWIAREPVTHADWAAYLAATPETPQDVNYLRHWGVPRRMPDGMADVPIYHLWPEHADAYAAWAGARLPSADEWEKAVRATDGRIYPWGDVFETERAVTAETRVRRPLPVHAFGSHGPAGLFSASGGVFEYTSTSWRDRENRGRVVMGGCFTHAATTARAALRLSHKLSGNLKAGLRLAWDA
jgi:formylglycine-generating enzyme required for sulfatase activity